MSHLGHEGDPGARGKGDGPHGPPRWLRLAVSLWLVFHLGAIIIAPAAVGPSSELVHAAWNFYGPYIELLYLNHGYHFFAPEPEESTLVAYEAERPDGTVIRGRIPDPEISPACSTTVISCSQSIFATPRRNSRTCGISPMRSRSGASTEPRASRWSGRRTSCPPGSAFSREGD